MAELVYRGIVHETGQKPVQTLAEQMRRPVLTYRGVEHDGEQAIEAAPIERRQLISNNQKQVATSNASYLQFSQILSATCA